MCLDHIIMFYTFKSIYTPYIKDNEPFFGVSEDDEYLNLINHSQRKAQKDCK